MKLDSLNMLLLEELMDLYDAEQQLVKALPKMAEAANSAELKDAFDDHLQKTHAHVARLEESFEMLGREPKAKTCKGMRGLIDEGRERMKEDGDPAVLDAGLITAAQKVEHYEISGYGSARTFAELLGETQVAAILQTTLDEEGDADKQLTGLARSLINIQAAQA